MNKSARKFIKFYGEIFDLYNISDIMKVVEMSGNPGECSFCIIKRDGGEILLYFDEFALYQKNKEAAEKARDELFKMLEELNT